MTNEEQLAKRVTSLETTVRKIQKSLESIAAELGQRGLTRIQKHVAAGKPVRMTPEARQAQLRQLAATGRAARARAAAAKKKSGKK